MVVMNSLYAAGGLVGALSIGWMADKIGRKRSIQVICLVCLIATVITTASVNIAMFLVGRGLQGLGAGMIDTICPLYQSEVSPAHARGRMVGSHAFLLVCGYVSPPPLRCASTKPRLNILRANRQVQAGSVLALSLNAMRLFSGDFV